MDDMAYNYLGQRYLTGATNRQKHLVIRVRGLNNNQEDLITKTRRDGKAPFTSTELNTHQTPESQLAVVVGEAACLPRPRFRPSCKPPAMFPTQEYTRLVVSRLSKVGSSYEILINFKDGLWEVAPISPHGLRNICFYSEWASRISVDNAVLVLERSKRPPEGALLQEQKQKLRDFVTRYLLERSGETPRNVSQTGQKAPKRPPPEATEQPQAKRQRVVTIKSSSSSEALGAESAKSGDAPSTAMAGNSLVPEQGQPSSTGDNANIQKENKEEQNGLGVLDKCLNDKGAFTQFDSIKAAEAFKYLFGKTLRLGADGCNVSFEKLYQLGGLMRAGVSGVESIERVLFRTFILLFCRQYEVLRVSGSCSLDDLQKAVIESYQTARLVVPISAEK